MVHFRTQGASTLDQWITNFVGGSGFHYYIKKKLYTAQSGLLFILQLTGIIPEWEIYLMPYPEVTSLGFATSGVSQAEQSNFRGDGGGAHQCCRSHNY